MLDAWTHFFHYILDHIPVLEETGTRPSLSQLQQEDDAGKLEEYFWEAVQPLLDYRSYRLQHSRKRGRRDSELKVSSLEAELRRFKRSRRESQYESQ